jgi:ABC-type multidrug transport system permease subunit
MRQQRWFPPAALAVGLFAINAVTRLIIRHWFNGDDSAESRASIVMFALIGLVLAVWTFIAAQRKRPSDWLLPDVIFGAVGGLLLTVLVGPFINGDEPFTSGVSSFFGQVWLYAGFAIVGTLLGYWIAVVLGRDYRSRSLKAYTQRAAVKPRRVVRR